VKTALDDIEPSETDDARVFLANDEEESGWETDNEPSEKVESPMPDTSKASIILKKNLIWGWSHLFEAGLLTRVSFGNRPWVSGSPRVFSIFNQRQRYKGKSVRAGTRERS